jgi:hypothetical protein
MDHVTSEAKFFKGNNELCALPVVIESSQAWMQNLTRQPIEVLRLGKAVSVDNATFVPGFRIAACPRKLPCCRKAQDHSSVGKQEVIFRQRP